MAKLAHVHIQLSHPSSTAKPVSSANDSPLQTYECTTLPRTAQLISCILLLYTDASQAEAKPTNQKPQQPAADPQDKENAVSQANGKPAAAVQPKSKDEVPEGIKALRSKFAGSSNSSDSSLPQVCSRCFVFSTASLQMHER